MTGCSKKDKLVLECSSTIKDSGENIHIKFYNSNTAVRSVTVKVDVDKDGEQIIESLKQNYCNNQIKNDYSCEVREEKNKIILMEKSKSNIIMGETKNLSIDKYQNNLEKKGFKCSKNSK